MLRGFAAVLWRFFRGDFTPFGSKLRAGVTRLNSKLAVGGIKLNASRTELASTGFSSRRRRKWGTARGGDYPAVRRAPPRDRRVNGHVPRVLKRIDAAARAALPAQHQVITDGEHRGRRDLRGGDDRDRRQLQSSTPRGALVIAVGRNTTVQRDYRIALGDPERVNQPRAHADRIARPEGRLKRQLDLDLRAAHPTTPAIMRRAETRSETAGWRRLSLLKRDVGSYKSREKRVWRL